MFNKLQTFILLGALLGLIAFYGCKQPCKGTITYSTLDARVPHYFYKVGSYWVYRDSATGNIDSQYVYAYEYRTHYRNPIDSPNKLYNPGSPGSPSDIYCGPYYLDDIVMHLQCYKNGVLEDTLTFYSRSADGGPGVTIYEHDTTTQNTAGTGFFIDWTKLGFLYCCYSTTRKGSTYDTTGSWYNGIQPSVISGQYTFPNVSVWGVQIGDNSSIFFAYPTDLYITSGSGIIKIIQHLPTGDVKWNLINYHITT